MSEDAKSMHHISLSTIDGSGDEGKGKKFPCKRREKGIKISEILQVELDSERGERERRERFLHSLKVSFSLSHQHRVRVVSHMTRETSRLPTTKERGEEKREREREEGRERGDRKETFTSPSGHISVNALLLYTLSIYSTKRREEETYTISDGDGQH